jgi:hypothetical protein
LTGTFIATFHDRTALARAGTAEKQIADAVLARF